MHNGFHAANVPVPHGKCPAPLRARPHEVVRRPPDPRRARPRARRRRAHRRARPQRRRQVDAARDPRRPRGAGRRHGDAPPRARARVPAPARARRRAHAARLGASPPAPSSPSSRRELHAVERRLADPALAADLDAIGRALAHQERLLAQWAEQGGDRAEGEARTLLDDLGVTEEVLAMPTSELSGGQRKLVALAACLARRPDVLMLDEPEAHLDMHRRDQLERIVDDFDGAVLMVSHDRHLLDACVGAIAELDRGRIRIWPGGYSRLRGRPPARAREATAAVRHAAEGDRAPGGGGPPLPPLGAHHGQRARGQAGARQADADRQDGEGRSPGARAAQDGARAAQRRPRRPAGDRARGASTSRSIPATRCCSTSSSRSCAASASASSDPTAPARPHSCARSAARWSRRAGSAGSAPGSRSATCHRPPPGCRST